MTHLGILCPPESGHLNTMIPLGQELQKRGHRLTFMTVIDAEEKVLATGLELQVIGEDLFPKGSVTERLKTIGQLSGFAALTASIQLFKDGMTVHLRDAPTVIQTQGIEALLIDQSILEGGTIAELLGIPFVTICSAVVLNREANIPPCFTPWKYNPTWWGRLRNQLGYRILEWITQSLREVLMEYRQKWHLPAYTHPNDTYSPLAQISQQPAELEFPRQCLPQWFHFTGPYHDSSHRKPVPFPWEKLTGQPLIYVAMGTVHNRLTEIFKIITSACEGLNVQLVMTLGGTGDFNALPAFPGNPVIVNYAPQLDLLQNATLTITHAGMNTTLESLTNGVPIVAIPMSNDQPGIAARIVWAGVGEMIPMKKLEIDTLHHLLQQVLVQDTYRENALRVQQAIHDAGGVNRAADIIEQAVWTGQPV
ncbi:MAG: glycosyltransferase, partial [Kamptonema sp. SIO4C4]|nr:glycosyltransferase [Kamptonema sp. SIO4C4]